ncbi:MAG: OmpA family protein, partial [Rhodospirillales bacterium]|nr:OmpA family protein [Rhodospirillales bacterium]
FRTSTGVSVDGDYDSHAVMVGLRWSFGAPAPKAVEPVAQPEPKVAEPAPQPAPAPVVVPRTYLVFFDWDKDTIRPDALEILKIAAANYPKTKVIRIDATGHADRSGADRYNMALSKRRAEMVKKTLSSLGVPDAEIQLMWKGEREPLVATPDGVREPQNRRVEIIFK